MTFPAITQPGNTDTYAPSPGSGYGLGHSRPCAYLMLVRHGQSTWNEKDLFTGWRNPPLTDLGRQEARQAGERLKHTGLPVDMAFTSALQRAQETQAIMLAHMGYSTVPVHTSGLLNERNYGDLSGLNKKEMAERFGADQVHLWRRSLHIAPPGGESLEDTQRRVLPYYVAHISPSLRMGKNVLVTAHGNSIRALVAYLEKLGPTAITHLNISTGAPFFYGLDPNGLVLSKKNISGDIVPS